MTGTVYETIEGIGGAIKLAHNLLNDGWGRPAVRAILDSNIDELNETRRKLGQSSPQSRYDKVDSLLLEANRLRDFTVGASR